MNQNVYYYQDLVGHIKILQWLLSKGCTAKTDDLGGTPLHDAAEHGQLEVSITSHGAEFYLASVWGRSHCRHVHVHATLPFYFPT